MERLLHYVWQHKLFPAKRLTTPDGKEVEVIDVGLRNTDAGPDFFNAKIKIDGTEWVGNVEIHTKSSDWFRHGHDADEHYNNVILHIAEELDRDVYGPNGHTIPQIELHVPERIVDNYDELLREDAFPPCYRIIPSFNRLTVDSWLSALQVERLEQKSEQIAARLSRTGGDWETTFFITMARNFGFGINGDAFEDWAYHIPLLSVGKHRNDILQIEAFFLGQAGLLEANTISDKYREAASKDEYFDAMKREYTFLAHKFSLKPMNANQWRFLRLRPQNFPHIRLAQLANLYFSHQVSLSQLVDATTPDEARALFQVNVTPYWESHYSFGNESRRMKKTLRSSSLDLLLINTVIPILFAYGRARMKEELCDRALSFLEAIKAENNHFTRMWEASGIEVKTAADSQALIQLRRNYCERKDCLRCRFGYEYLLRGNRAE